MWVCLRWGRHCSSSGALFCVDLAVNEPGEFDGNAGGGDDEYLGEWNEIDDFKCGKVNYK